MLKKVKTWVSNLMEVARLVFCVAGYFYSLVLIVSGWSDYEKILTLDFSRVVGEGGTIFFLSFGAFGVVLILYLIGTEGWKKMRKYFGLPEPLLDAPCCVVNSLFTITLFGFGLWLAYMEQQTGVLPRGPEWFALVMGRMMYWSCSAIPWFLFVLVIVIGVGYLWYHREGTAEEIYTLAKPYEDDE